MRLALRLTRLRLGSRRLLCLSAPCASKNTALELQRHVLAEVGPKVLQPNMIQEVDWDLDEFFLIPIVPFALMFLFADY